MKLLALMQSLRCAALTNMCTDVEQAGNVTNLDLLAVITAAIIHVRPLGSCTSIAPFRSLICILLCVQDYRHPGVTNQFLTNTHKEDRAVDEKVPSFFPLALV